jgi:uncharacterized Tic20 family protein
MTQGDPIPPPPSDPSPAAGVPPAPGAPAGVPSYASPGSGATGYPNPYAGPTPDQDSKTMGMLAHLLGIFLGFIGPLIIWLIKKDQSPFVDDQGKESLNFQIMLMIGYVIGTVTSAICIGFLIIPAVWIFGIIFSIMACLKAKDGIAYRYPVNLRLIK